MASIDLGVSTGRCSPLPLLLSLVPWPRTPLPFSRHWRLYECAPTKALPAAFLAHFQSSRIERSRLTPQACSPRPPRNLPLRPLSWPYLHFFFPIVTEPRARGHPVQTIAVVLPILAPFHQCWGQVAMSGQSTPVHLPSGSASLRLTAC